MANDELTFIELLARMGLFEPILTQHYEVGGRCCCCRGGSIQSGRVLWPCTTAASALKARELARGNRVQ